MPKDEFYYKYREMKRKYKELKNNLDQFKDENGNYNNIENITIDQLDNLNIDESDMMLGGKHHKIKTKRNYKRNLKKKK